MWTQTGGLTNRSRGHRQKPSRPDKPEQGTSQGGLLGMITQIGKTTQGSQHTLDFYTMVTRGVSLLLGKSMGTDASLTLLLPD